MFIIISLFKTIKKICPQQSKGFSINQSNVRLVYYMTYVFEQYVDHVRINSRTIFYLQLKKFIKLCILTSHHAVPPGPPPSLVSYILCILLSHLAVLPSPRLMIFPLSGWESQLLETGFLAIWLVPVFSLQKLPINTPTSKVCVYGYRWLLFRIMIGAGLIKVCSLNISVFYMACDRYLYFIGIRIS